MILNLLNNVSSLFEKHFFLLVTAAAINYIIGIETSNGVDTNLANKLQSLARNTLQQIEISFEKGHITFVSFGNTTK